MQSSRSVRGWRNLADHYNYTHYGAIQRWVGEWEDAGIEPFEMDGNARVFDLDQIDQWRATRQIAGGTESQKEEIAELQAEIEGLEADKLTLQNALAKGWMVPRLTMTNAQMRQYTSLKSDLKLWLSMVTSEYEAMNDALAGQVETLLQQFYKQLLEEAPASGLFRQCMYRAFSVRSPMKKLDWIVKNHYLSARATTTDGQRFVPYPFQRGLIFFVGDYRMERFYFQKPAKIGWTQILKGCLGHELAEMGRSVGMWLPRDADKNRFANLQMRSMIQDIPAVGRALVGDPDIKSEDNNVDRITFESATLFMNAAKSAINFRDFDVDSAYVDEISAMDKNVGEEGSIEDNAMGRTAASNLPIFRTGSTPKTVGNCNVSRLVSGCREVFERWIKCPDCGHEHVPDFGGDDADFGLKFVKKYFDDDPDEGLDLDATAKTVRYQCPGEGCGMLHPYSKLRVMDEGGQWRSKTYRLNESIWEITDHEGNICDPPSECGAKMSALLSYDLPWSKGASRFLRALIKKKEEGDPTALIHWYNEYRGLPWLNDSDAKLVAWEVLQARAEVYGCQCPAGVQAITAYIDLHPTFIAAEVKGWGYGLENWSLKYIHEMGSPLTTNILERVIDMIKVDYMRPDGSILRPSVIGIDTGWEPGLGYKWHKSNKAEFIACKGNANYGQPIMVPPPKNPNRHGAHIMWIGTDTAKDHLFDQMLLDVPGPGYAHFPDNDIEGYEDYDDDYYKGIPSEVKRTRYVKGHEKTLYEKRSRTIRNEPLDCFVGNMALIRLLLAKYGVELLPSTPEIVDSAIYDDAAPPVVQYLSAADIFEQVNAQG